MKCPECEDRMDVKRTLDRPGRVSRLRECPMCYTVILTEEVLRHRVKGIPPKPQEEQPPS